MTESQIPWPVVYADWRISELGKIAERLEQDVILKFVDGRQVLDIGCGEGVLADALKRRGAITVGLDASQAMLGCRRRALCGIDIVPRPRRASSIRRSELRRGGRRDRSLFCCRR